jgi:hypothetical protein
MKIHDTLSMPPYKGVYLKVHSNDLREYTATHHANAWYIMGSYY